MPYQKLWDSAVAERFNIFSVMSYSFTMRNKKKTLLKKQLQYIFTRHYYQKFSVHIQADCLEVWPESIYSELLCNDSHMEVPVSTHFIFEILSKILEINTKKNQSRLWICIKYFLWIILCITEKTVLHLCSSKIPISCSQIQWNPILSKYCFLHQSHALCFHFWLRFFQCLFYTVIL
jgi:hypothetical protein